VNVTRTRAVGVLGGACLLCLAGGAAAGSYLHPRVVERVEWRDRDVIRTETKTITVEKPVDRWRTRIVEVTRYDPQGRVTERISADTTAGSHEGGTETTVTGRTDEERTSSGIVERSQGSVPPWRASGLLGWSGSGAVVGGEVSRQLFGPFEAGAWVAVPLQAPQQAAAGLSLGVRW